jgi:hypothetical protein
MSRRRLLLGTGVLALLGVWVCLLTLSLFGTNGKDPGALREPDRPARPGQTENTSPPILEGSVAEASGMRLGLRSLTWKGEVFEIHFFLDKIAGEAPVSLQPGRFEIWFYDAGRSVIGRDHTWERTAETRFIDGKLHYLMENVVEREVPKGAAFVSVQLDGPVDPSVGCWIRTPQVRIPGATAPAQPPAPAESLPP